MGFFKWIAGFQPQDIGSDNDSVAKPLLGAVKRSQIVWLYQDIIIQEDQ